MRPSTSVTSAPYSSHSRMKGTLTSLRHEHLGLQACGRGIRGHSVRGIARRRNRQSPGAEMRRPRHRGRQPARLERVGGIERFVLDEQPRETESAPSRARVDQRRPSFAERDRVLAVEERHQLPIPPHGRRRVPSATRAPGPRRVEVVAGEERSAACAEVVLCPRVKGPAPQGTLHSRWVKYDMSEWEPER